MNNHAGSTLTRPTGTTFSHMDAVHLLAKVASGGGLSRVPETIQMGPVLPQRTPLQFSKGKVLKITFKED